MSIVKLVNAGETRVHVTCVDKMLPPGGFFAISESELERNSELLTCVVNGVLTREAFEVAPAAEPEGLDEEIAEEAVEIEEPPVEETAEEVPPVEEKEPQVHFCDIDKDSKQLDNDAFVKYGDDVVKVAPFTAQVGKEADPEPVVEGREEGQYIDGVEIIDTTKREETMTVDGIDMIVDNSNEKDEYGSQFIESD